MSKFALFSDNANGVTFFVVSDNDKGVNVLSGLRQLWRQQFVLFTRTTLCTKVTIS